MADSRWTIGDVVHDRDDDDPDPAIVVNTRDTPAEEWDLPRLDTTLAEDNPDYPSDAPVVTVLFEDTLADSFPDWDRNAPISYPTLDDHDLRYYSFPAPRLESGEPPEATDPATDPATETADEATSSSTTGECEIAGSADADTDAEPSTPDTSQDPSETVRTLQKRLDDGGMLPPSKTTTRLSAPQNSEKHIVSVPVRYSTAKAHFEVASKTSLSMFKIRTNRLRILLRHVDWSVHR